MGENGKIDDKYFFSLTLKQAVDENGEPKFSADGDPIFEGAPAEKAMVFGEREGLSPFNAVLVGETMTDRPGESNLTYRISIMGVSGSYYIAVKAQDSLDNESIILLDSSVPNGGSLNPVDAAAEFVEVEKVSPREAMGTAAATSKFNVPVYVLPQNMVTTETIDGKEANLVNIVNMASNYSLTRPLIIKSTDFDAEGKAVYKLYITDELKRAKEVEVTVTAGPEGDVTFNNAGLVAETYVVERDETTNAIIWGNPIGDGEMAPAGRAYYEDDKYSDTVIVIDAPSNYVLRPNDKPDEWGYYPYNSGGASFSPADSIAAEHDVDGNPISYSRLVYETNAVRDSNGMLIRDNHRAFFVESKPFGNEKLWDISGTIYEVTVENIDNTLPEFAITVSPDTTYGRKSDGNWGPLNYTVGPVRMTAYTFDPDTGLKSLTLDISDDKENQVTKKFDFSEINEYPHTYELWSLTDENFKDESKLPIFEITIDGTASDPEGVKTLDVIVRENMDIAFLPENGVGATGADGETNYLSIDYIQHKPISADDYTLSYYYQDYLGKWQSMTPGSEGTWFKKAKAVVTPTASGIERGLRVTNLTKSIDDNGNIYWEKPLDAFDHTFTFILADDTNEVMELPVKLSSGFDETPGQITFDVNREDKTNSPLPITIKVKDGESGTAEGCVSLRRLTIGGLQPALTYTEGNTAEKRAYDLELESRQKKNGKRSAV